MQAIIDAIEQDKLNAHISVVISNKKNCYALERARKHNMKAVFISAKDKDREDFDKEVAAILDENNIDLILLIGYMKIISAWFCEKYKFKIMNIHPSLLPKYASGMDLDVHAEVLKNKEKITGCTLHFVTENVDEGPIILQKEVPIEEDDTKETLKPKVQKAEQEVILKAIKLFDEGKIKVEDNKVIIG